MSKQGSAGQPKGARNRLKRSTKSVTPSALLPEPTERDLAVGREAKDRLLVRRKRPQVAAVPGEPGSAQSPHNDPATFAAAIKDAFGTTSDASVERASAQLSVGMYRRGAEPLAGLNAGLAVVAGIRPENEVEAQLAIQMAATHEAAMSMLASAQQSGTLHGIEAAGNLAVKLLRTYTTQTEALAKLRRGGEQTVRVEHVHVYPGGQAIVGNVSHGEEGGTRENYDQPHEPIASEALTFAPCTPLRGKEPGREPVSGAGCKREETVLEARRSARKRRP